MNSTPRHHHWKLAFAWLAFLAGWPMTVCAAWTPPPGIPAPSFGIEESHTMYTNRMFDFGNGAIRYPNAGHGPYTHYVDMNHSSATDDGNPFGTPSKPRQTWPLNVPAGSVVEVHGGPYVFKNQQDKMALIGEGTESKPIFFRGVSTNSRPVIQQHLHIYGSYVVVENMKFDGARLSTRLDLAEKSFHHLAFRFLDMHGTGAEPNAGSAIGIGTWRSSSSNGKTISHVVVYGNNIQSYGNWHSEIENDWVGAAVGGYDASNVWIVDNEIFHMGGDGVRVGSNAESAPFTSTHVYIGRNRMYEIRENALDIKAIGNVIVSQNVMHDFLKSASSGDVALVAHYNPSNIWLLGNDIYAAAAGVVSSGVKDMYLVNNYIHDVGKGVEFWGPGEIHIVNNTIARVDFGVRATGGASAPHPLINNIIASVRDLSTGYHVFYSQTTLARNSELKSNLFFQEGGGIRARWGKEYASALNLLVSNPGSGCLEGDPLFDKAEPGFRLQEKSRAINRGTTIKKYEALFLERWGRPLNFDIEGKPRLEGHAIDIGASEFSRPDSIAPNQPPIAK